MRSWAGLGVVSGSLGPLFGRLGPYFAAKESSHTTQQKKHENQSSQNPEKSKGGGTGARLWGHGKTANSYKSIAKASPNTRENANPTKMA